jgi:hypothetical protein
LNTLLPLFILLLLLLLTAEDWWPEPDLQEPAIAPPWPPRSLNQQFRQPLIGSKNKSTEWP